MRKILMTAATLALVVGLLKLTAIPVVGQSATPANGSSALKTPWGEPDLQGIWMDEWLTPFARPDWVAGRALFTDQERRALDERRVHRVGRDFRATQGTVADVSGAYSEVFRTRKRTGPRTSLIVDPPDGKMPAVTPEVLRRQQIMREYDLMLLQASAACKDHEAICKGGQYGPPSPKFHDPAPIYPAGGQANRSDGPEDGGMGVRCLQGNVPTGNGFAGGLYNELRRIVQTPGGITMVYDVGQGQGFQRNIVMNGSPHLPATVRQWWGDSRGRWEGATLVIDVTNFNDKVDFFGSRGNMHLVERFTRTGPSTLDYVVTMEDAAAWMKPWTVKQELTKQSEEANRIYAEPRCHEGNYGLPGLLHGARLEEQAFAEGRGPNPAEICQNGCNGVGEDAEDTVSDFEPLK